MCRFLLLLISSVLLVSCNNYPKEQLQLNKIAEESLLQSIQSTTINNHIVYTAIEQRLSESYSADQAKIWQPKALLIKAKSDSLFNYLEGLINELKKNSGLRLVNFTEVYDEGNADAVTKTIAGANSPEKIISKLYQYKNDVLAVDPDLNKTFGGNIVIISTKYQTTDFEKANSAVNLFKKVPVSAAIVLLRGFQNNIKNIESEFILYCFSKIPSGNCGFQIIRPLISQSSNIVSKGEKIRIVAGIGAYSVTVKPKITIDGKIFESGETDGFAEYEFKASDQPGKYSKVVIIEFTGPNGQRLQSNSLIKYMVKE